MNEIQLFLAVMLSFKSSKGLIFFSMIFFEHTTVLVTFFRSFLFFCFTGMVYFEAEIAEAEGFFLVGQLCRLHHRSSQQNWHS